MEDHIPERTPPCERIPLYITSFQSSPVRICRDTRQQLCHLLEFPPSQVFLALLRVQHTLRVVQQLLKKWLINNCETA